jgi:hypothetical protein
LSRLLRAVCRATANLRRFRSLSTTRPLTSAAEPLRRFLARGQAKSAISHASLDTRRIASRSRNRRTQAEPRTSGARRHGRRFRGNRSLAIPEAWRELVEKGTEVYSNT